MSSLLKPSDLTNPLLQSPSSYSYRSKDWEPKGRQPSLNGGLQPDSNRLAEQQQAGSISAAAMKGDTKHPAIETAELMSKDTDDNHIESIPHNAVHSGRPLSVRDRGLPRDILEQLMLSDSKLAWNQKLLNELENRRLQQQQQLQQATNSQHVGNDNSYIEDFNKMEQDAILHEGEDSLQASFSGISGNEIDTTTPHEISIPPVERLHSTGSDYILNVEEMNDLELSLSVKQKEEIAKCPSLTEVQDTSNDSLIAVVLQEELEKERSGNRQKPTSKQTVQQDRRLPTLDTSVSAATPCVTHKPPSMGDYDYEIARKMQEQYDKEIARTIQQEGRRSKPLTSSSNPLNGAHVQYNPFTEPSELVRQKRLHYFDRATASMSQQRSPIRNDSLEFTYEELSELEDVPNGYDKDTIQQYSTVFQFKPTNTTPDVHCDESNNKKCFICLTFYETGELLRLLPCLHSFHCECIDTWLSEKKTCPICLRNIV